MKIEEKVASIIEECFDEEKDIKAKLLNNELFTSLGISSVDFIKAIVEIEDVFGVTFDDDFLTLEELTCLGDVAEYLKTLL